MPGTFICNTEVTASLKDIVEEMSFVGLIETSNLNLEVRQAPKSTIYIGLSLPSDIACITDTLNMSCEDWINTLYEVRVDRIDANGYVAREAIMMPLTSDTVQVSFGRRRIKRKFVIVVLRNLNTVDTTRTFLSTQVDLIPVTILDRQVIPIIGLKYDNQYRRILNTDLANNTNIVNKMQPTSVPQFRMFNPVYPIEPKIPDPTWTHKKYRCLTCNAELEVDLDSSNKAVLREFRDQYAVTYAGLTFWSQNTHNRCPLLMQTTLTELTQAITDGLIIEL